MIVIGVDGGGTKTAVEAFAVTPGMEISPELMPAAAAKAGPMNYNFVGVDAAADNLMQAIAALGIAPEEIGAVGIADPSIDDCMPADETSSSAQFVKKVQNSLGVPVFVRSDAYITLYGLTGGQEPAVLQLAGTGAMAISQDKDRKVEVAGGWGRLTGDEGSGYYIGVEAVKAALQAADGIAPATVLTEKLQAFFGVQSPRELIPVFYGDPEPDIAAFSKVVDECARQGDEVALGILQRAAQYLAAYTGQLIEKSGSKKVGIYGSVLCQNRQVRQTYEQILVDRYKDITVTEPPVSAARAAAMYAAQMWKENN